MKKKMIAIVLTLTMMLTMFAGGQVTASAETEDIWGHEGIWSYYIEDGEATLTGCTNPVGDLTIPDTLGGYPVIRIDYLAFNECTELTSIVIPQSVSFINDGAFYGCSGLNSITLPDKIICFEAGNEKPGGSKYTFYDTGYYNDESNWNDNLLYIGNHLIAARDASGEYVIKDGTKYIDDHAFDYVFPRPTSISLPDSIEYIGAFTFSGCDMTSITLPDSLTRIGWQAFSFCSLTSITIPDSVTEIDGLAFASCVDLTSITIPESVTSIGVWAFDGCDNLTIYGYADSYAETYASENEIPFVVIEKQEILGDLDGSEAVDVGDIMKIKDLIMSENWTDDLLKLGDLDNSGSLDVGDIMALKNLIMGS